MVIYKIFVFGADWNTNMAGPIMCSDLSKFKKLLETTKPIEL